MIYKFFFKRIFDIITSLTVLIFLGPLLCLLALLLFIHTKGNPFFVQIRPGKDEQRIKVIKFKSMTDKRDANGNLLPDSKRITSIGEFIRKTSLDELPQLLNVLKGDMSIVGPRPLLFKYIPLFTKDQKRRHNVKPGITGLAQVSGRNSISWTDKFRFDTYYVDNMTFLMDLKIIWLTLRKVIKREGVNQSANRPMVPFDGFN